MGCEKYLSKCRSGRNDDDDDDDHSHDYDDDDDDDDNCSDSRRFKFETEFVDVKDCDWLSERRIVRKSIVKLVDGMARHLQKSNMPARIVVGDTTIVDQFTRSLARDKRGDNSWVGCFCLFQRNILHITTINSYDDRFNF